MTVFKCNFFLYSKFQFINGCERFLYYNNLYCLECIYDEGWLALVPMWNKRDQEIVHYWVIYWALQCRFIQFSNHPGFTVFSNYDIPYWVFQKLAPIIWTRDLKGHEFSIVWIFVKLGSIWPHLDILHFMKILWNMYTEIIFYELAYKVLFHNFVYLLVSCS